MIIVSSCKLGLRLCQGANPSMRLLFSIAASTASTTASTITSTITSTATSTYFQYGTQCTPRTFHRRVSFIQAKGGTRPAAKKICRATPSLPSACLDLSLHSIRLLPA
jgi:hypothetical protein